VAISGLAIPFLVVAAHLATSSHHVFLSDDLALIDLNVRDALHLRQQLGPWDRFGWNHPGPSYFYFLALVARLVGAGARADFLGAAFVNGLTALGIVWAVRREAGRWAALWSSLCVGLLALILTTRTPQVASEASLGAVVSPWNPYVVILPLVLFATLCAIGTKGSWAPFIGALLVGSFVIQTNIGTLPVVGPLLLGTLIARFLPVFLARIRDRRHQGGPPGGADHCHESSRAPWLVMAGIVLLVLTWVPTLGQQATNHPGNLTLIWRFFTTHHGQHPLSVGLSSIGAMDGAPSFALSHPFQVLGASSNDAILVLAGIAAVGTLSLVFGVVCRCSFAGMLAGASLVGLAGSVVAVTRIVGPVDDYLVVWAFAIPTLALVAGGVAVLSDGGERRGTVHASLSRGMPRSSVVAPEPAMPPAQQHGGALARSVLVVVVVLTMVVLTIDMARVPPLSQASDRNVAALWRIVAPALHGTRRAVHLGVEGGAGISPVITFEGLFLELTAHGYRACVDPFWTIAIGKRYLCRGHPEVSVRLFPPSAAVERARGYVGRTGQFAILVRRPDSAA